MNLPSPVNPGNLLEVSKWYMPDDHRSTKTEENIFILQGAGRLSQRDPIRFVYPEFVLLFIFQGRCEYGVIMTVGKYEALGSARTRPLPVIKASRPRCNVDFKFHLHCQYFLLLFTTFLDSRQFVYFKLVSNLHLRRYRGPRGLLEVVNVYLFHFFLLVHSLFPHFSCNDIGCFSEILTI